MEAEDTSKLTGSFRLFTKADQNTRFVRSISFYFVYKFNCFFGHSHKINLNATKPE